MYLTGMGESPAIAWHYAGGVAGDGYGIFVVGHGIAG